MDLCSRNYAFMSIAGMAIFVNPWTPHRAVAEELYKPSGRSLDDFYAQHGADATRDLLCRASSLIHEVKHFHDILFTPFGHRLFWLAFKAVLRAHLLLTDRKWRKAEVALPVLPEEMMDPEPHRLARQDIAAFKQALRSAKFVLESSATMAQLQGLWTTYGADAKNLVEQYLADQPEYSRLLNRLERIGRHVLAPQGEFGPTFHRLLLFKLGSTHFKEGDGPDVSFDRILARLESADMKGRAIMMKEAVDEAWSSVVATIPGLRKTEYENLAMIRGLKQIGPGAQIFGNVYEDFLRVSHAFQDDVLSGRTSYLDLAAYVTAKDETYRPLMYMYADDEDECLVEGDQPDVPDDLFFRAVYKSPDAGPSYYSDMLHPAKSWNAKAAMSKDVWIDYLKEVVPATVFIDEVDWRNPLTAFWMHTMGEQMKVQFTRRM
jgi:hypothetical protein